MSTPGRLTDTWKSDGRHVTVEITDANEHVTTTTLPTQSTHGSCVVVDVVGVVEVDVVVIVVVGAAVVLVDDVVVTVVTASVAVVVEESVVETDDT